MRRARRGARGAVLAEALAAVAVFGVALGAAMGALIQSSRDVGIATEDQEAYRVARSALDQLLVQPSSAAGWTAGVTGPSAVAGHPGFTLTLTVSDVSDAAVTGSTLAYKKAHVQVDYKSGRSTTLEAFKW